MQDRQKAYLHMPSSTTQEVAQHTCGSHMCAPPSLSSARGQYRTTFSDGPSAPMSKGSKCKAGLTGRTLGAKQARRQAPWAMRRLMTRASATSTSIRSPPGIRSNRKYRCSLSCAHSTCSGAFAVLQAFTAVLQQQVTELMLCLGHTSPCKGSCHWLPARATGCS